MTSSLSAVPNLIRGVTQALDLTQVDPSPALCLWLLETLSGVGTELLQAHKAEIEALLQHISRLMGNETEVARALVEDQDVEDPPPPVQELITKCPGLTIPAGVVGAYISRANEIRSAHIIDLR